MDLRTTGGSASAEEMDAVDRLLGPPGPGVAGGDRAVVGGHGARSQRQLLLPALHAVQDRVGWISRGALDYVARRLSVPPAEAYGVASFYAMLATRPRPARVVHVCDDIACRLQGAGALCERLGAAAGPASEAIDGGAATWLPSPCLGLCERGPAALLQQAGPPAEQLEVALTGASAGEIERVLRGGEASAPPPCRLPQAGDPSLRLLRRVGVVDPQDLDSYRAAGGYSALRAAIGLGPDGVIREVTESRLLGRGGAAFPMGRKWDAVARAPRRPHLLICNADESEPGTFKDRVLMEEDPFAVVESMTIAAFATGSERGYLYVRGEYPLARSRIGAAIAQCRARGLLGEDVMGHGFRFDIEVRRGGGAYICGEETALFNSIEGRRGEPRNKPPFPAQSGLFGLPTAVNNVETLVNVLEVMTLGGQVYARIGTEASTGTKLFCVSGEVARPGLYELEFGATLGELLDLAGAAPLGAVLMGGAAGSFVTERELGMPLTIEGTRAAGTTLGSGVVMVFGASTDLRPAVLRIARFFRDESCGQCVPCRVGTVRQEEVLHRLAGGGGSRAGDLVLFQDVASVMRDASICGLGQTASSAAESAVRLGVFD